MITIKNTMKVGLKYQIILTKFLIIAGSGSGKTNTLLNLINELRDIDKIYLYAKDLSECKYEHLINNRKNAGIKYLNDSKAFIDCSNTMDDVYENIGDYNPNRKRKVLIIFDAIIADIMANKKFQSIIDDLFIRCRKKIFHLYLSLRLSFVFFCTKGRKIKFNALFIMKINNKRELQNIATNHSADIEYKDFIKIYRECTKELYIFLTIDATLPSTNP